MSAAHIQIARGEREFDGRTGPKAAFEFFLGQSTHTAAARRAEIRSAGNKKAQFNTYCALYGDQFGTVNGNGAVRSNEQVNGVRQTVAALLGRTGNGVQVFEDEVEAPAVDPIVSAIAEKLGVSVEILAKLVTDEDTATVEAPTPVKAERTIPAATRISFKMAMALRKIATVKNVKFEITGKTGGEGTDEPANYGIKFAGRKLTPATASKLIADSKK